MTRRSSWLRAPGIGPALLAALLFGAGACACWAIDNNLTRTISAGDPLAIAAIKGCAAGLINICVAPLIGQRLPNLFESTNTVAT